MLTRAALASKWLTMEPRRATATYHRRVSDTEHVPVAVYHLGVRNPVWRDTGADPRLVLVEVTLSLWADEQGLAGLSDWSPLPDDWFHLHDAADLSDTKWVVAMDGVERKVFGTHWHLKCVKKRG